MSHSEIVNIAVSIVSIIIALVAIFQTKQQIALSNKQQLFDRRLSCFLEFNTIYKLYVSNKLYLKDESTFYHTNDLVFSWLTNCIELEEMTLAVSKPLHQEEQKMLLTKYEKLKNLAIEISMIFDGETARIAGEFVSSFADLLKSMYQQQVYISKLKEQETVEESSEKKDLKKDDRDIDLQNFRRQIMKIQRGEISILPRCEWKLANNNFLLHGYYNYRHLVLIDEGNQLKLGVPGIYHEREARAAATFGFPEFIAEADVNVTLEPQERNENQQFGYWCRQVRRPPR